MDELQNALHNMTDNKMLYENFFTIGLIISHYV